MTMSRVRVSTKLAMMFLGGMTSLVISRPAGAVSLRPGDIVFAQDGAGSGANNAVVKADPITGNRTLISQTGVLGTGPDFGSSMDGMAIDPSGNILLTCYDAGAVFKIDPATGNRTILSSATVGTGPTIQNLQGIALAPDGAVYVTVQNIHSVVRIDPNTGNRTLISGPNLGNGPVFPNPAGLTLTPNGDLYVYDANNETVTFVNDITGDRTIVSGAGVGSGPPFGDFGHDVALLTGGFLATTNLNEIDRVDIATGARSVLSDASTGSGPALKWIDYLTVGPDGSLIASGIDGVYRVNPSTGDRTWLTGTSFGTGPKVGLYREAVIIVPEPSNVILASVVSAIVIGWRTSRRGRMTPESNRGMSRFSR